MSKTVESVVISQTKYQVLARITAGERLRWVPCSMVGLVAPCRNQRVLALGNDFLDDDIGLEVVAMERSGKLIANEDDVLKICDYSLA